MPLTREVGSAMRIKVVDQGKTPVHRALLPSLNLPHHLIDLIAEINLSALPGQLGKTAALRQQPTLR